jgi:hypothetical protein
MFILQSIRRAGFQWGLHGITRRLWNDYGTLYDNAHFNKGRETERVSSGNSNNRQIFIHFDDYWNLNELTPIPILKPIHLSTNRRKFNSPASVKLSTTHPNQLCCAALNTLFLPASMTRFRS